MKEDCLYVPYLVWVGFNVGVVFIGAMLVAYVEVREFILISVRLIKE